MQKEVIIIDVKTEAGRAELQKLQSGVKGVKEEPKKPLEKWFHLVALQII